MSIEERVGKIEKQLVRTNKTVTTLYHRSYARLTRRQDAEKRMLTRTKRWSKMLGDNMGISIRLGKLVAALDGGKHVLYVSHSGRQKLLRLAGDL